MPDSHRIDFQDPLELAVVPIASEFESRLTAPLNAPDLQAVQTAIAKAAVAGIRIGVGHMLAIAAEVAPEVDLRFSDQIADSDAWEEKYGGG